jgi:hypothetical protein
MTTLPRLVWDIQLAVDGHRWVARRKGAKHPGAVTTTREQALEWAKHLARDAPTRQVRIIRVKGLDGQILREFTYGPLVEVDAQS